MKLKQQMSPNNEKDAVLECLIHIHGDLKTAVDWCGLRAAMQCKEEGQEEAPAYWRGLEIYGQYVLGRLSAGGWSLCSDCRSPLHYAQRKGGGEVKPYNQDGEEHTSEACCAAQKELVAMQERVWRERKEEESDRRGVHH